MDCAWPKKTPFSKPTREPRHRSPARGDPDAHQRPLRPRRVDPRIAREDIRPACRTVQTAGYNFLVDVTCVDWYPNEPRFQVTYHILSHSLKQRIRFCCFGRGGRSVRRQHHARVAAANFYEREVFDLFGVRFGGHPNLRRIMMPDDWQGHPCARTFRWRVTANGKPQTCTAPLSTVDSRSEDRTMILNMGPQHPSTHGVLRLVLEIDGEIVVRVVPGHRLSAHRHREDLRGQVLSAGGAADRPHRLSQPHVTTISAIAWRSKNCCNWKSRSARSGCACC